jgi:hypothetical protein
MVFTAEKRGRGVCVLLIPQDETGIRFNVETKVGECVCAVDPSTT